MNNKVLEQDWKPSDNIVLEDAALASIKEPNNVSIVAGPGAGKTELLAHKAGYLIETGICTYPKKILAISFKVDAASNLQERVEKRYGKDVSSRFESRTFDSFAKGLLDQFLHALPEEYKPAKQYEIISNERLIDDIIKGYITDTNVFYPSWQQFFQSQKDALIHLQVTHKTQKSLDLLDDQNDLLTAYQLFYFHVFLYQ